MKSISASSRLMLSKAAPKGVHCRTETDISLGGLANGRQRLQIGAHLVPGPFSCAAAISCPGVALRSLNADFSASMAADRSASFGFRKVSAIDLVMEYTRT